MKPAERQRGSGGPVIPTAAWSFGPQPSPLDLKGALIPILALTRGFPLARLVRNPETVSMMADGSLLRSGGETWGPVSPDNVHETGVSPGGQSGSPIVAADPDQVERTRRKTSSPA
jgi:hypothetical protein